MADEEDKNLPNEELIQQMLSVQGAEIEARRRELEVRASDLDNHRRVAIASIEAKSADRDGSRQTLERESTKSKRFILILVSMLLLFIAGMVVLGQAAAIFDLLKEVMKYVLGGFGGAGLTLVYLSFKKEA